jgi:hypothetical protein
MSRLDDVRARRAALVERAEAERLAIGESVVALERPMTVAGRAFRVVAFVRANPVVVVGAIALLMLILRRPRRREAVPARRGGALVWAQRFALLDFLRRGFSLWRSVRRIQRVSSFVARVVR